MTSFVDWYNYRHRFSDVKFVTPDQRKKGDELEICHHRAVDYEQARQENSRRVYDRHIARINLKRVDHPIPASNQG